MGTDKTVFISYSWDNEEHKEWVDKLYVLLRKNGIETLIDRRDVSVGDNLETYMNEGISKSKFIICICSTGYNEKISDLKTGVGKEVELIELVKHNKVIIPIIKNNVNREIPKRFQGLFYLDFEENSLDSNDGEGSKKIRRLLERINNVDKNLKPSLGSNPFDKSCGDYISRQNKINKTMYSDPRRKGSASFDYSNNDGKYIIGTGEFSFTTKWSKANDTYIYAYKDGNDIECIALLKGINDIPKELPDIENLDFTSRARSPYVGDAIIWMNKSKNFAITLVKDIKDCSRNDAEDLLKFDYKIYLAERPIVK